MTALFFAGSLQVSPEQGSAVVETLTIVIHAGRPGGQIRDVDFQDRGDRHTDSARAIEQRVRASATAVVCAVTVAVSIAALGSPALMRLFVKHLPHLRTGQWWRVVTPVLAEVSCLS